MAKMTNKGRGIVSNEISHLMKDGPSKGPQKGDPMAQKQAVAVALDVARRKGFKTASKSESAFDSIVKAESAFDDLVQEASLFDELTNKNVDEDAANWDDRVARTLTLAENLVGIRNSLKK